MKFDKEKLRLYAVTDRSWLNGESLVSQVEKALKGGAGFIQLREKTLGYEEFLEEAREIKALCDKYNAVFIVNDEVEIAAEVGASGVHVGQSDMEALAARKALGDKAIIGVSCHNVEEALAAQAAGADYLGAGAVFHTGTKTDVSTMSYETLSAICSAVDIPVVAIGGISQSNMDKLAGSGIAGVAVVSAVFAQPDIEAASRELLEKAKKL